MAKRIRKLAQVFNLRQLATPFGQSFKVAPYSSPRTRADVESYSNLDEK